MLMRERGAAQRKEKKKLTQMTLCAMTEGTSCGIPDFRSRGGLYAQLASSNHYDLDDPQQMSVVLNTPSS